jgi:hypothetical protein
VGDSALKLQHGTRNLVANASLAAVMSGGGGMCSSCTHSLSWCCGCSGCVMLGSEESLLQGWFSGAGCGSCGHCRAAAGSSFAESHDVG